MIETPTHDEKPSLIVQELDTIRVLIREARALRNANPSQGVAIAAQAVTAARALATAQPCAETSSTLGEALAAEGHCHRMSSSLVDAVARCSEASELLAAVDNRYAEALARSQWGIALVQLGELAAGLAQMESSREISEALGNEEHVSDCLLDIGVVNNMLGDDARAIELYTQAMRFFEKSGDHYHHATCLSNIANAHVCWGRRERAQGNEDAAQLHFSEAQTYAARSITLARLSDDVDFLALRYVTLADAQREAGDLHACLNTLETQLPLTEMLAAKRTQARCLSALADALVERAAPGDEARAVSYLERADALCEAHSLVEVHAGVLGSLTQLHEKFGRAKEALAAHKRFHGIEIRIHADAAERDTKTLEARLRAAHVQKELDLARQREAELTALNARLREQQYALERIAHVDVLTGLANRRAWLASLESAWALNSNGLFVYLLDLDHFKLVNDTYGHTIGDTVLIETAHIVTGVFGGGEVGRFGGEEFVAWVRADEAHAEALAERLIISLRAHAWSRIAAKLEVTASLGWCAGHAYATPYDALSQADRNMYTAKRSGRDRSIGAASPLTQ
jgi:two-component system, cell cycle response regulator